MTTITTSEWMRALESAMQTMPVGDEGMTFEEIRNEMRVGKDQVSLALKAAKAEGRLAVGHRRTQAINGRWGQTPVYRLLP